METADRINQRLKKLLEYVEILNGFGRITREELEQEVQKRGAVERYLQLAAEVVLDVANLLNAEYKFRPAKDSADSILILGEVGVLEKGFAQELAKMAGFRNILVHDYLEIDYTVVAVILSDKLTDLEKFAGDVAKYISQH